MSSYTMLVAAHALVGTVALATFWLAALLRKGGPAHRRAGKVYLMAMLGILLTGFPLAIHRFMTDREQAGAFLAFLLVLVATTMWTSWRAIRDKHDLDRYLGPVYRGLAIANLVGAAIVIALGLHYGNPLLMAFPLVGVLAGVQMLRKRAQLADQPRWWVTEHYSAMLGNGAATHIAFLAIGLPRLLPQVSGDALQYLAWFGPVGVSIVAGWLLDRRWKATRRAPAAPIAPAVAR